MTVSGTGQQFNLIEAPSAKGQLQKLRDALGRMRTETSRLQPDGTDLRRHTHETEYFVRFPATDGSAIVYMAGAQIRSFDAASDRSSRVAIETPSASPQTARRFIEISADLESFAPSPDGTALALVSRGRPLTMPLWEEAVVEHGAGSRVRYREAQWLHDGQRFVCVSDEGGSEHPGQGRHDPAVLDHRGRALSHAGGGCAPVRDRRRGRRRGPCVLDS